MNRACHSKFRAYWGFAWAFLILLFSQPFCAAQIAEPTPLRRNNLAVDLVSLGQDKGTNQTRIPFHLTEDRWLFITAKGTMSPGGKIDILIDQPCDLPCLELTVAGRHQEKMIRLTAGTHHIQIDRSPSAQLTSLVIRQVPSLIFCKAGATQRVKGFTSIDWKFLKKHILSSINTLVVNPTLFTSPELTEWRQNGGQCWVEMPLPGAITDPTSVTTSFLSTIERFSRQPDGVLLNELDRENKPFQPWLEFLTGLQDRLSARHQFLVPYWGGHCETVESQLFLAQLFARDISVVRELYLPEPLDFDDPHTRLQQELIPELTQFPGATGTGISKLVMALGYQSAPPESLDINPQVDFKVWMDHQMYSLATDHRLGSLGGVMHYISRYADEEYVRWAARLYRHYALEGRTDFLSETMGYTFALTHTLNGDFGDGFAGWKTSPAAPDHISIGTHREFSAWQGLIGRPEQGRTFVLLKQHPKRSSRISQPVRHLVPGQLYSLRFISANTEALAHGVSSREITTIEPKLIGADILASKSFHEAITSTISAPFTKESPPIIYFHRVVFRAKTDEAQLILTIRPSGKRVRIGPPTAISGVQIQPYFLE